jgi:hypothetical protein
VVCIIATGLAVYLFGGIAPAQIQAWLKSFGTRGPVSTLTITKGGTYSGNWQSINPNVPAVLIKTSQPVVIQNSRLQGRGNLIQADDGNVNVTVRNTKGYGLNPRVVGRTIGRFLAVYKPFKIVVEHCYMESTSGIYLNGDTSAPQSVKIRYNRARNIDGRKSDGNGGFSTEFNWAQFVQLDKVQHAPKIEIAWNEVINKPYKSRAEDNISIYLSSGTSSSPIQIHDNYIQGGYPTNPATDKYSGGGIMLGDGSATSVSNAAGFVRVYNNQVVSTTNYGIAIAAGHDNQFYNNRIISSGLLPDGTRIAAQNIGAYVWDTHGDRSKGTFYNNFAHNNTVGWVKAGGRNDWWFPDCASGKCMNNTNLPDPITLDTEKAEYQTWVNKVATNNVTIGAKFAY